MGLFDFWKKKEADIPLLSSIGRAFGISPMRRDMHALYRGWVYTSVEAISEEVSTIDLVLTKSDSKGNKETITSHPALAVINDANPFMTKQFIFKRLQAHKELFGNEYWYIVRKGNTPAEIYPLLPSLVSPIPDEHTYVSGYNYRVSGKNYTIPKEDIIHFKNFSAESDIIGMSTLEAVRTAVETDYYAKEYNKSFFENSAQAGVVLTHEGEMNDEMSTRLLDKWNQNFQGPSKNFRTALLQGGLKMDRLQTNHADMEFIEQRKFSRDEILAIFRVPKTIIGILEDANFASAKTANYVFALRTISPKMRAIVDTLNEFFLPMFGDPSLKFDFRNPVPEDRTELISYYQSGINNGWLTLNEVRAKEGLTELENGNETFLPFSLTPYTTVKTEKGIAGPAEAIAKDITENLRKLFASHKEEKPGRLRDMSMNADIFEKVGKGKQDSRQKRAKKFEKKYEATSMKLFNDQTERAIANLEKELDRKDWKGKQLNLLDEDLEIEITIDLFTPLMNSLVETEGQAAFDMLKLDDEFDVSSPDIQKFIKANVKKFAGSITETSSRELRAIIASGVEQNESINQLKDRIENYSGFSETRATMIALTEVSRGQNKSELEAWDESGVVKAMIWYTALDERVDDECGLLHGKEIDLGDNFLTLDEMAAQGVSDYDGAIDSPPLHPNCRCVLIPVIDKGKRYEPKKPDPATLLQKYLTLENE